MSDVNLRSASFVELVGKSHALKHVQELVKLVAPTDATVLLLGETGTGKELIARSIHALSERKNANLVNLNCAAIPAGLLESELFGHEKGAYTDATDRKIGRLESAHNGTLFLDEIGELPLELQPKLLRALEDREFERVGGTRTIKINLRVIAATNKDLRARVAKKEFRSDLFYRLHIFPVHLPPLRERKYDIPVLVDHFLDKFAQSMGKGAISVGHKDMQILMNWVWPGNIRELANVIERSVILTEGPLLQLHMSDEAGQLLALKDAGERMLSLRRGNGEKFGH